MGEPAARPPRPWIALSSLGTRLVLFFVAMLVALAGIDWDTTLLPDNMTLPLLWASRAISCPRRSKRCSSRSIVRMPSWKGYSYRIKANSATRKNACALRPSIAFG